MRTAGISVRPLRQMTGDAEFSEVFFDDVRVPAGNLIGAGGAGWGIAMGILAHERGPVWTFTFQRKIRRSLERLIRLVRESGRGGDPLVRQRIAQAHVEVELLRLVGYRSLTRMLRTGEPGVESSIEKVLGSETDQRLLDVAMEVLGPHAVLPNDFERSFLYARSETIMGGTSEIQRNVIAQRLLGLPR
jgi:alkylation response protein AidB-like acyl-CoA dehydrogenase